jgi:hypothetical protein
VPYRTREHEWIAIYRLGGPSLMSLPVNLDFKQATCLCYTRIPDVYRQMPHWKGPTVTSSINTRSAARILGRRVANVPKPCHVPLTYGRYRNSLTEYLGTEQSMNTALFYTMGETRILYQSLDPQPCRHKTVMVSPSISVMTSKFSVFSSFRQLFST